MRRLCKLMNVHHSGFYQWLHKPKSFREHADNRLTGQIKQYWLESGCHYGYRNIHLDLREAGIDCGRDRVLRLMRLAQIKALRGYDKPKGMYGGKPHHLASNRLDRQFEVNEPNEWWVSDNDLYKNRRRLFVFNSRARSIFKNGDWLVNVSKYE